jgi:hypothetical protein
LLRRYGSWQFDASQPAASAQNFALTFTAGFAPAEQSAPGVTYKPPPPLVIPLNPDLFYPFLEGYGSSAGTAQLSVWGMIMGAGVAAGMLLL